MYNSGLTVFWPILCIVSNIPDTAPFPVSVFCEDSKPDCLDSFLKPFLDEMIDLETNGITVNGEHFTVSLTAVICDAPARSFIKRTINHNGQKGCERCTVVARKIQGRMSFIPTRFTQTRTDKSFRDQHDKDHHKGKSPFEKLKIDMVKSFPLDYMHLALLGVMKRLILNWVGGKRADPKHKLSSADIEVINNRINQCSKFFPSEFHRKGREIDSFRHWKAVEFRSFLIYSGVVVLKDVLPADKYKNFLLLHVSFRILLSPKCNSHQIQYAGRCLVDFVNSFEDIYGAHNVVFNVHNLLHIAEDCLHFNSSLEHFNCFPFENYLGELKRMLKGTRKPLAQLYKRIMEIENCKSVQVNRSRTTESVKSKTFCDSFYILQNEVVGKIVVKILGITDDCFRAISFNILKTGNNSYFDFYDHPVKASDLSVYISVGFEETQIFPIEMLQTAVKCVALPSINYDHGDGEYQQIIFPLLHQLV